MCGIVGAVGGRTAPSPDVVTSVLGSLAHRGPDAEGQRWHDGVWLGFRRLAILDLQARADQPMVDEESGVAVVFNGEIYNYVELRDELAGRGHRFLTTGDTEVVLRGWVEWGEELFRRCNGMWAVAVQERGRPGVVLARDRFGEKPLHLGVDRDGRWWFGSEVRALCLAGVGGRRLDLARTLGFLVMGDVEDPARTFVEGIEQVRPGELVHLTDRGIASRRRWFDVAELVERARTSLPGRDDEVRSALDEAVRLRLRSDVAVGTSLSGGLDSSAVVAALRSVDPVRELHAFTATFPGRAVDELHHARLVAERFSVDLHPVEPTLDGFLDELDDLVSHQGGPIESPTVYAQWCVQREAQNIGVTVLLDGQGADETWGGYPKYVGAAAAGALLSARPDRMIALRRSWSRFGDQPRADLRQIAGLLAPAPVRTALLGAVRRRAMARLGPAFIDVELPDPQGGQLSGAITARAAQADLGRVILPRLLRYADRNSMAMSREVRLPYLDPQLLEFALASDWDAGLRVGWTKLGLRRAVAHRLPPSIAWRRDKVAYATPDREWLEHPRSVHAIAEAQKELSRIGLLEATVGGIDPWRVVSLARFVDRYGLQP